ncbi:MAG: DUF4129 domain-containing protein [Chloroflexi bacterium]|jgi:hypothetical protein|nr:DUF4129 domain-containing protein [Chloroflexota bacterium]
MPGIDLRRWRWLESGLIPLVSALMRVAWVTPLLHFCLNNLFVMPRGVHYPAWLVLVLLLAASALDGLVQERPDGPAIMAGAGMAAVLVVVGYLFRLDVAHLGRWLMRIFANLTDFSTAFPATLLVVIATALIWRRGMTVAWHDYGELFRGFVTGVLVLGFLLLVPSPAAWLSNGLSIWGSLIAFVFSALLSLAMISAHQTLAVERLKDERVPPLSRQWVVVVGSMVLAVMLTGWLVAQVLSPDSVKEILRLVRPVWEILKTGIMYVILAIAYVFFWALGPLIDLIQSRVAANWQEATKRVAERLEEEMQMPEPAKTAGLPPALVMAIRILVVTLLVVGVAVLLYRAYRRRARRTRTAVTEQRESVLSRDLLAQQLRDLLAGLRRKPAVAPFLQVSGEDPRVAIRRLYRQMLERLSALGRGRPPQVTPYAYSRSLGDLLPSEGPALRTLTEAYLVARYAPDPPTAAQVDEAGKAWESISSHLGG